METVGQCDNGYACVYQNNLSWSTPTTPLPAEAHPRLVFEDLFGEGGNKLERKAALKRRASLLDFVKEDMASLKRELGPDDRAKVDDYLDTVREVERRIQKAESDFKENPLPDLDLQAARLRSLNQMLRAKAHLNDAARVRRHTLSGPSQLHLTRKP
ncbi:MAG: DUF1552 domain-containing protein [Pseudomonadota bacterium]